MITRRCLNGLSVLVVTCSVFVGAPAFSQSTADLDARLTAVEEYLEKLPPSMATYAGSLEESINSYTKNLENGLTKYSERLERSIESRLTGLSQQTIELDIEGGEYKKIETSTGSFLIAVTDAIPTKGGYKLSLQIGNANYADYRDFTLRIVWGQRWHPDSKLTYAQWRESLTGSEFNFKGQLLRGKWNSVEVELYPATNADLAYVECEMGVASIELEVR